MDLSFMSFQGIEWVFSGIGVIPVAWILNNLSFGRFLRATGPKISGKWNVEYLGNGAGYCEFKQFRNRIWGKLYIHKSKSGNAIDRSFDISGWLHSNRLTATYEDRNARGFVVGAIAAELFHDGKRMDRKVIFFKNTNGTPVTDYVLKIYRP